MDAVFLKLSVCCLPLEIKVCFSSEKNEKGNSVGQNSANMASIHKPLRGDAISSIISETNYEIRKSRSIVGLPLFEMEGLMAVWKDIQTKDRVLLRARQSGFDER